MNISWFNWLIDLLVDWFIDSLVDWFIVYGLVARNLKCYFYKIFVPDKMQKWPVLQYLADCALYVLWMMWVFMWVNTELSFLVAGTNHYVLLCDMPHPWWGTQGLIAYLLHASQFLHCLIQNYQNILRQTDCNLAWLFYSAFTNVEDNNASLLSISLR